MPERVAFRLYLLRDELENLISRETEGRARCQNFPTHRDASFGTPRPILGSSLGCMPTE